MVSAAGVPELEGVRANRLPQVLPSLATPPRVLTQVAMMSARVLSWAALPAEVIVPAEELTSWLARRKAAFRAGASAVEEPMCAESAMKDWRA